MKVAYFVIFASTLATFAESGPSSRRAKLLPIFSVVKFPNDACLDTINNRNGTCYTTEECSQKGGTSSTTCASGFGVCCLFSAGCGASTNENCTYFESSGNEVGQCQMEVCRCNSNICQLRLDFDSFVITGPSTESQSVAKTLYGRPTLTLSGGVSVSEVSQCLTDTFSVTNSGNHNPSICGIVTGEHMYVDANEACNDLVFQLGSTAQGTALAQRQWSIKVSQYSCEYSNLAPQGCTQYFFGSQSQTVKTFNFDGGLHLADQNQNICVRRERGFCKICWTTAVDTDFQISGTTSLGPLTSQSVCCGYTVAGSNTLGYDCLTIPGARTTSKSTGNAPSRICGRSKGLVTTLSGKSTTICTRKTPFNLRFVSDQFEVTGASFTEAALTDIGFQLTFIQSNDDC